MIGGNEPPEGKVSARQSKISDLRIALEQAMPHETRKGVGDGPTRQKPRLSPKGRGTEYRKAANRSCDVESNVRGVAVFRGEVVSVEF